ncbi:hypothetical protein SAMN02745121_09047 [Nannocystis exedens]|uniref:Uncharacterized protein n=1 Tax=Nannocystis exedens TaxID=54 RepID=A0A1I2IY86_9BACT|nr:hypothetical protein [Nannocystis exedens]SFF46700.1 hypothetical protein SAMN02745121_09047 [Nannocystis exedens]
MLLPAPPPVELLVPLPVVPGWPPVVGVASVLPLLVPGDVLLVLPLLVPLFVPLVLSVLVLVLVLLVLPLLVPLLVLPLLVPLLVLPLLVPLLVLPLLVPLLVLPLLVPLLVLLPVSLPPDVVSPAGRHRSMAWQVSPSPRQVSSGEHAPPWTCCGSGKQSRTRMHAFVAWQIVPSGHSSSFVQTRA